MRRIVIFGASSQIAQAILDDYLKQGPARVVLAGRPGSRYKDETLARLHGRAETRWIDFDATDTSSHPAIVAQIWAEPVDVAVIAFGVLARGEDWRDHERLCALAATNFTGALSVGSLVADRMARDVCPGVIIALSSVAGERVRQSNFAYGASKAGMDGFFVQLGAAVRKDGVHVLVVRPGAVRTKMLGSRRVALSTTPEKVAKAVWKAVRHGKTIVRVPAIFTVISAVFAHLPRWVTYRT